MFGTHILKRPAWLILAILVVSVILSLSAAQCGAPAPVQTVVVKETVEVAKEVIVTKEVEKEVVVTQEVEKQVLVTATPEPEAPKPTGKITVWMWKATQDSIVNPGVVEDFNKVYPDIQVEWVTYNPQDVYQKLPLALSAGTGAPDVCYVEDSHLTQYVYLGGLTDLTERVQPYLDKMNNYKWAAGMKDGKYYFMPMDSGPVVTYYRRDVFEAAGLASDPDSVSGLVATWDDYFNTCKTIKEKTGHYCFASNKANNYARLYEMMLWQQGLGYYNEKGAVTVDSPENIATLEMLGKFWEADLVSDQLEWTDSWYAELASLDEPVASLVEAAWMGVFLKTWIAPGTAGKWGVASMPAMKEGQVRTANDGGSGFVIPEQSQNKDAAWAFVEFVTARKESQNKIFAYGDIFPSFEPAYEDALYIEPDSFFGGQMTRKVYVDMVKQIPVGYVYGQHYALMNGFVSTAIQQYAAGQMSAADALKEAADAIRQQTGLE
jgi:lactose/L-arabinose transport system substrate-binding protein